MRHNFEHNEIGIQFTGTNLSEMGDFLVGTFYEFNGDGFFFIPSPRGDVVVKHGEWLVKRTDGTFYIVPGDAQLEPVHHINELKTVLTKKKRGGKKK